MQKHILTHALPWEAMMLSSIDPGVIPVEDDDEEELPEELEIVA